MGVINPSEIIPPGQVPGQAVVPVQAKLTPSQMTLIRRTIAKELLPDEFDLFMALAHRRRLDPFSKQILPVIFNAKSRDKRQLVCMVAIDGLRSIAKRSGTYMADCEEPVTVTRKKDISPTNPLGLVSTTVTVYAFGQDRQYHPIKGRAKWAEFAPIGQRLAQQRNEETGEDWYGPVGDPVLDPFRKEHESFWRRMPEHMLAKCAEAQAIRKGWPEETGGLFVSEELDRGLIIEGTATEVIDQEREQRRLEKVGALDGILLFTGEGMERVEKGKFADRILATLRPKANAERQAFLEMNRLPMQEFWARERSDALALKKEIESLMGGALEE